MKKIICTVLCTVIGLVAVSCEVDSLSENSLETTAFKESVDNINFNFLDSSSIGDVEGPGDEVFPIKPPKKIN